MRTLSKPIKEAIRTDLSVLFQEFVRRSEFYNVNDIEGLKQKINNYYLSLSPNPISHNIRSAKSRLRFIHSEIMDILRPLSLTHPNSTWDGWIFYYTFDINKYLTSNCNIRFYLNPTLEGYKVLLDLLKYYISLPLKSRGLILLKIADFSWEHFSLSHFSRSDQVVIYCSPKALPFIEPKLRTYYKNNFYDSVPLFTEKINRGVSKAYSTKEETGIHRIIKNGYGKEIEKDLSYGQYISYLIAVGIQIYVERNFPSLKTFSFHDLNSEQQRSLYLFVLRYAETFLKDDLLI